MCSSSLTNPAWSLLLLFCRCLEAFCIYGSVGRVEEPYVSITRKKQMPRGGQSEEVERQVGQAEGKLFTHRAAFARTSVIQAFLGSAPQLTLQLYICVLQQGVSIGRGEVGGTCAASVCVSQSRTFNPSNMESGVCRRFTVRCSVGWSAKCHIGNMRTVFSWVKVALRNSDIENGNRWFSLPVGPELGSGCRNLYVWEPVRFLQRQTATSNLQVRWNDF